MSFARRAELLSRSTRVTLVQFLGKLGLSVASVARRWRNTRDGADAQPGGAMVKNTIPKKIAGGSCHRRSKFGSTTLHSV
jgi:hypothetical protein